MLEGNRRSCCMCVWVHNKLGYCAFIARLYFSYFTYTGIKILILQIPTDYYYGSVEREENHTESSTIAMFTITVKRKKCFFPAHYTFKMDLEMNELKGEKGKLKDNIKIINRPLQLHSCADLINTVGFLLHSKLSGWTMM